MAVIRTTSVTPHEPARYDLYRVSVCNLGVKDGPKVWICGKIIWKYRYNRYLDRCGRCERYRRLILGLLQRVECRVNCIRESDRFAEYYGKVERWKVDMEFSDCCAACVSVFLKAMLYHQSDFGKLPRSYFFATPSFSLLPRLLRALVCVEAYPF